MSWLETIKYAFWSIACMEKANTNDPSLVPLMSLSKSMKDTPASVMEELNENIGFIEKRLRLVHKKITTNRTEAKDALIKKDRASASRYMANITGLKKEEVSLTGNLNNMTALRISLESGELNKSMIEIQIRASRLMKQQYEQFGGVDSVADIVNSTIDTISDIREVTDELSRDITQDDPDFDPEEMLAEIEEEIAEEKLGNLANRLGSVTVPKQGRTVQNPVPTEKESEPYEDEFSGLIENDL